MVCIKTYKAYTNLTSGKGACAKYAEHFKEETILKPNLIRLLSFASIMSYLTYLPILAKDLGLSEIEIGLVVASYSLTLFFSSFIFGRASDRTGRKSYLLVGLSSSAIAFFMLTLAQDFSTLLILAVFVGFCLGIYPASLIAYVHERKRDLSRFSSFGSLGWTFGLLAASLIVTYFSINSMFIFGGVLFLSSFLTVLSMDFPKHIALEVPRFPSLVIRKNLSLYLAILIRHSGATMIWTFWPLFLRELGANLFWIGIVQTINALSQFVFMYTLSRRIRYTSSIIGGLLLSGITFLSFTLAADFWQILPLQVLLGISWALMYVGALRYLTERNVEKATTSGLLESVLSLSAVIGPLVATFVIAFGGYRTIMYLGSALAFLSFLLFRFSKQ
ncbi:MAG: MFS transporter [Candidatus Bathyarchaeota archaeon]|nr:MFS transporter [Candidatus Bathyarchaeota archaeon]